MDIESTNGLRWYFLEAYLSKKVANVKEFAELTNIPKSCMQRYLNGIGPRDEDVLRKIEHALGKPTFDIQKTRAKLDWEGLVPALYSNKPSLCKKYCHEEFSEESGLVREDFPDHYTSVREERLVEKYKQLQAENEQLKRENDMLQLTLNSLQFI